MSHSSKQKPQLPIPGVKKVRSLKEAFAVIADTLEKIHISKVRK